MMKNPAKMMGLVENIGSKLDTKIKSGEIKESELLQEATNLIGCMKDIPGMPNMAELFGKMSNSKTSQMKSRMGQQASKAKVKERLQKKLQTQMESKLKGVDGSLGTETQELIAQNKRQVEEMQRMLEGGNK
jgi:hypothetical protein